MQELKKREDAIAQQETETAKASTNISQEKDKIVNAYAIVKKREESTTARLEQAIKLENEQKNKLDESESLKLELEQLIEYQRQNLMPCKKTLVNVRKAIYNWMEVIGNVDGTIELYNYIGDVTKFLDRYIDKSTHAPNKQNEHPSQSS